MIRYLIGMYKTSRMLFSRRHSLKSTWKAFLLELKFTKEDLKKLIVKSNFPKLQENK